MNNKMLILSIFFLGLLNAKTSHAQRYSEPTNVKLSAVNQSTISVSIPTSLSSSRSTFFEGKIFQIISPNDKCMHFKSGSISLSFKDALHKTVEFWGELGTADCSGYFFNLKTDNGVSTYKLLDNGSSEYKKTKAILDTLNSAQQKIEDIINEQ